MNDEEENLTKIDRKEEKEEALPRIFQGKFVRRLSAFANLASGLVLVSEGVRSMLGSEGILNRSNRTKLLATFLRGAVKTGWFED